MPYQGDRERDLQKKFTVDLNYIKKLPGILIVVQLICCGFAFLLSLGASFVWKVNGGAAFFILTAFVSSTACLVWLAIHVFQLYSLWKKEVNWNMAGLVFNGVCGFFVMVASCVMIEVASAARTLRAAGVFGFLGFTAFLVGLAWEVTAWRKSRDDDLGFTASATVVQGPDRPNSRDSYDGGVDVADELALQDDHDTEAAVGFKGMKARPVSSFLQEPNQNGGVTTPMLTTPGNNESSGFAKRPLSSGGISEKSENSSNASSTHAELTLAS